MLTIIGVLVIMTAITGFIWNQIKKQPDVVIMGGDSKNGGNLTNSLIQAEMAKQLINKKNN